MARTNSERRSFSILALAPSGKEAPTNETTERKSFMLESLSSRLGENEPHGERYSTRLFDNDIDQIDTHAPLAAFVFLGEIPKNESKQTHFDMNEASVASELRDTE